MRTYAKKLLVRRFGRVRGLGGWAGGWVWLGGFGLGAVGLAWLGGFEVILSRGWSGLGSFVRVWVEAVGLVWLGGARFGLGGGMLFVCVPVEGVACVFFGVWFRVGVRGLGRGLSASGFAVCLWFGPWVLSGVGAGILWGWGHGFGAPLAGFLRASLLRPRS